MNKAPYVLFIAMALSIAPINAFASSLPDQVSVIPTSRAMALAKIEQLHLEEAKALILEQPEDENMHRFEPVDLGYGGGNMLLTLNYQGEEWHAGVFWGDDQTSLQVVVSNGRDLFSVEDVGIDKTLDHAWRVSWDGKKKEWNNLPVSNPGVWQPAYMQVVDKLAEYYEAANSPTN